MKLVTALLTTVANSGSTCQITRIRPVGLTTVRTLCGNKGNRDLATVTTIRPFQRPSCRDRRRPTVHVTVPGVLSFLTAHATSNCIPNIGSVLGNCAGRSNAHRPSIRRGVTQKGGTVITLGACHRAGTRSRLPVLGRGVGCFKCNCVGSTGRLIPDVPVYFCTFHLVIKMKYLLVLFFTLDLFLICGGRVTRCQ